MVMLNSNPLPTYQQLTLYWISILEYKTRRTGLLSSDKDMPYPGIRINLEMRVSIDGKLPEKL
jgi:hypothetical protein